MANTKVPIELSSTPGIVDNSIDTAITIDSAGAATFSGTVTADGLTIGDVTQASNAIIKTQVEGSDVGDFDSGLQMRSHNNDFGGTIALESRSGSTDVVAFKYHNNSASGVRAMAIDATNGDISFYEDTGTTAKLFWDASAESLGIGTSSPISALHVDSSNDGPIFDSGGTNNANHALLVRDSANNQLFRVDNNGNVGLGTDSPSAGIPLTAYYSPTSQMHLGGAGNIVSNNTYFNGTAWVNRNSAVGGAVLQLNTDGSFAFRRAGTGASPTLNYSVRIDASGYLYSLPTYGLTTGSSANMFVATDGSFQRSTSSLRYKNTITDATHGLTELLILRPVTYKGNNDGDTVFGGLIAEEVHDAGLTEFVQYNDEGKPDALAYSNMVSLCIKSIQEQQAIIEALTARLEALEGA